MTRSLLEESDSDAILPVSIGTGVWLLVLVSLVVAKPSLDESGATWWIGAAAVGLISGAGGVLFLVWRKRRARGRSGQE
jgi:protein-S-isoprenylcysteine O-methyltransferase Ste14